MNIRDLQDYNWTVPPMWKGQNVFLIGGGASISSQLDLIKTLPIRGPVIAINNAWRLEPYADMLYFADRQWYLNNKDDLIDCHSHMIVSRSFIPDRDGGPRVKQIKLLGRAWSSSLSYHPGRVAGWCSGANAINIAYLAGAKAAYLFGFDMKPGRWHNEYKTEDYSSKYIERFIPSLELMASELEGKMSVFNCSVDSALTCFPLATREDVEKL